MSGVEVGLRFFADLTAIDEIIIRLGSHVTEPKNSYVMSFSAVRSFQPVFILA